MAKVTNVNLTPATGSLAMFDLHEFLDNQMLFTIAISGDGIAAFDNTGTSVILNGGSGANGLANTDAYFVARDPVGGYEWLIQRNTTDTSWEVLVSALDGFTGGSATVRPTATDEQSLVDGTLFFTNGSYRWHLTGDTVAVGATVGVYPWRAFSTDNGTGVPRTLIAHEPLDPGTYPELTGTRAAPTTGEPDPSIYIASYTTGSNNFTFTAGTDGWNSDTTSPAKGYYCMNGPNGQAEAFTAWQGANYFSSTSSSDVFLPANTGSNDGIGVDPRDGSDPMMKFLLARDTRLVSNIGYKGFSGTLRIKGVDRDYPDTLDVAGQRFVYAGDLLIPWENGTTPLT